MLKRFWVLLSFVFLLSLAFSQDSLHMRFVGSWECPSDDLGGGGEYFARVRKILDDYLVLGALDGDSLWILDVSDPSSPSVALCYADTAFSDEPGKIKGFEVKKDSGYIYVAYRKPGTHDTYVRLLRFIPNPLGIEKGMVVDVEEGYLSAGYLMDDSLLTNLGRTWNIGSGDTLIPVEAELVREGSHYPVDGDPASRWVYWWRVGGDSFYVYTGYIYPLHWDDSLSYPMTAAYMVLGKVKLYSEDACSVVIYGTWRTAYDDEMPTAAGVSEEHGFVVLGTDGPVYRDDSTGEVDSVGAGLYFVDVDSIIDSYPCMPRASLCMRGLGVGDIVVRGDLLYVRYLACGSMVVYDISDYPDIDTVAYYCCNPGSGFDVHTEIDGRYIYEFYSDWGVGLLRIFEIDSSVGIQGRLDAEDKLQVYPNPVFANTGYIRINPQSVDGYAVDISGRVVRRIENGEMEIDDLPPGIYLLNLKLGDKRYIKKILVI